MTARIGFEDRRLLQPERFCRRLLVDEFPLMLSVRPEAEVRHAVQVALESLSRFERMKLGPDLAKCIGPSLRGLSC